MADAVTNFSAGPGYVAQDAEDRAAVARCLAGDTAAFEGIVERYQRVFFTVAARLLGDHEAARDAAQDAFVNAFRRLDSYDSNRPFFSWIYRILVNGCLNDRRDRRRHVELTPNMATVAAGPADLAEVDERRRRVQQAILALSADYRQVIVLRHFTQLSYEQIAEVVGVPAKTVKSRLHTARERLEQMLLDVDIRR
jgi:RNA polymerase sigma-70 factor (ECF subfamily)